MIVLFVCAIVFVVVVLCIIADDNSNTNKVNNTERASNNYYENTLLDDSKYNKVIADIEAKTKALKEESREWERQFSIVMEYQNNGMKYEKEKEYDKAIESYESAIKSAMSLSKMHYKAEHSAERLAVLYRRFKQYDKEIESIKYAIECARKRNDDVRIEKYEQRLSKAELLLNKSHE